MKRVTIEVPDNTQFVFASYEYWNKGSLYETDRLKIDLDEKTRKKNGCVLPSNSVTVSENEATFSYGENGWKQEG